MASCKDCLHSNVCLESDKDLICKDFKDSSRFVELPCKVGDTVFSSALGKILEDKITNINIYDNGTRVFLKRGISFDIEKIGRMIFLSREEAEQALKEREL